MCRSSICLAEHARQYPCDTALVTMVTERRTRGDE